MLHPPQLQYLLALAPDLQRQSVMLKRILVIQVALEMRAEFFSMEQT